MNTIEVRWDIMPENAQSHGFIWWQDTIYDPEAPAIANRDLAKIVKEGWILGQPAGRMGSDWSVGLYRPIDSSGMEGSKSERERPAE